MRLWLRRSLIGTAILGLVAFGAFQTFKRQIGETVFQRAIAAAVGADRTADLPDGLHVFLCGTGSPFPDPNRAGSCIGVLAGDRPIAFDVGAGSAGNLARMGFPTGRLEVVFLTHLHSDHVDGLGGLMLQAWVGAGRDSPLPIRGPVGTGQVVAGFNSALRINSTYRTAHHGVEIANPGGLGGRAEEFALPAGPAVKQVVYQQGGLKITAFGVIPLVEPAFGYRVDYKDRSIAISGDTIYDKRLVAVSKGVDILFHDALQPDMVGAMADAAAALGNSTLATIFHDILDYHASPEDAARAAADAGVGHLVLYHIVPPLPSRLIYPTFLSDAKSAYDGPITIGEDGVLMSLPSGTD